MGTPVVPPPQPAVWTDVQGLANLRRLAGKDGKAALPAVARQFEAVFTQMLIKSMRKASIGGGMLDSPQMKQWRGVFDHQIALSLANDGKGLGIATMLEHQLGAKTEATDGTGPATPPASSPTALSPQLRAARTLAASTPAAQPPGSSGTPFTRGLQYVEGIGSKAMDDVRELASAGPDAFVRKLAPYARKVAAKLGVSMRAVMAQAALETGWGQHIPQLSNGSSSYNLFGIKSGDGVSGTPATASTVEFAHGVPVQVDASFRTYASPAQAFADYAQLLTGNPRYAGVLGQGDDIAAFAHALTRAGYATDPHYAAKLTAVADSRTMNQALARLKNPVTVPKEQP